MKQTRPFLKWAGNKYHCLRHLLPSFPSAKRLIEPFTGSGAVFMNVPYERFLLAEQNSDLVLLFRFLQQEGEVFINYCEQFFRPNSNSPSQYYQFRAEFNQDLEPRYRAALFLYLNRHGYNGLCRYNKQGIYNVPFGRYDKPYFPRAEMHLFHDKSQQATFIQADFRETFKEACSGDFIYCDPPYSPLDQGSNFSTYTSRKFGEQDQIDLAHLANKAANQGIQVIISNHDTELTREYYQGAEIHSFKVSRFINRDIHNRHPVSELIAIYK